MLILTSSHETWAHRRPAGAKLAALALWSLVLFHLPGLVWPAAAVALVAVAAFWLRLGMEWAHQIWRLWPILLVLFLWHLASGTPQDGAVAILRMLAAVGAATLVTMTTRLSDMQAVFLWLARPLAPLLPPKAVALAIALVIRFVPVMLQRWDTLVQAFRARSPRRPGWRLIAPSVLAALDDADRVAEALRARGGAG